MQAPRYHPSYSQMAAKVTPPMPVRALALAVGAVGAAVGVDTVFLAVVFFVLFSLAILAPCGLYGLAFSVLRMP